MADNEQHAFACATGTPQDGGDWQSGMTKREYFAGQALSALRVLAFSNKEQEAGDDYIAMIVRNAYDYADAMVAEGKKRGGVEQ